MDSKKDQNLIKRIAEEKINEGELLEAIDTAIEEEWKKPEPDIDNSILSDCIDDWYEVSGETKPDFDQHINEIKNHLGIGKIRKFARVKTVAKVAASFVIIIGIALTVNFISLKAFKVNLLGDIVEFGEDVIRFNFLYAVPSNAISLVTSEDDPYGLKAECAKHQMYPLLPTKLPDGTVVSSIDYGEAEGLQKNFNVLLDDKKHHSALNITCYEVDTLPNVVVPSESQEIEKLVINGIDIYIIKNEKEYIATFLVENTLYAFYTNMEYEQFIITLYSLK